MKPLIFLACLIGLATVVAPQESVANAAKSGCQREAQLHRLRRPHCPELAPATRNAASIAAQNIMRLKLKYGYGGRLVAPKLGTPRRQ